VSGAPAAAHGAAAAPALAAPAAARHRCLHLAGDVTLESGVVLRDVRQAYYLDGALNAARDNLVVVFHALTGSADAAGDWWRDVVGPGRALDTSRYAVLCANLLGSCYGSTGPADPAHRPFPLVTPRDMARLVARLVDALHVRSVALAVGGSLGGMVALELAATFPTLARRTVVLAAPAAHTAAAVGWGHVQRRAIAVGGEAGLEVARMVAMLTYRTADELEARFGRRDDDAGGGFAVERYLTRHGARLRARFDLHSYLALLAAMDAHDVGRDRGGVAAALAPAADRLVGVGTPGDLLYCAADVRAWTAAAGAEYRELRSVTGHDAFLVEHAQVSAVLADALG
jgi:homoserine O-acetyltransferase